MKKIGNIVSKQIKLKAYNGELIPTRGMCILEGKVKKNQIELLNFDIVKME